MYSSFPGKQGPLDWRKVISAQVKALSQKEGQVTGNSEEGARTRSGYHAINRKTGDMLNAPAVSHRFLSALPYI